MRKTFTFLCAALMSMSMFAQDPSWLRSGDEWDEVTKTLTVKSDLGYQAYESRGSILHLVIAEDVTVIGTQAFQHCGEIIDVVIPASVTSIGSDAFYGCTSVENVYCYPDPADLNWNDDWCDDFKSDHATNCHVKSSYLNTYNTNWGNTPSSNSNSGVNVTFVGDLTDPEPAQTTTTITWEKSDIDFFINWDNGWSNHNTETVKDVTITANGGSSNYCQFGYLDYYAFSSFSISDGATLTFSSSLGNLKGIVISGNPSASRDLEDLDTSTGWAVAGSQLKWTGDAASVVLTCNNPGSINFQDITSIVFTFVTEEPASVDPTPAATTITWNTDDLATVNVPTNDFQTIKTIRVTNSCPDPYNDYCHFLYDDDPRALYTGFSMRDGGSLIFTPESGRLTSIVINWNYEGPDPDLVPGSGWSFTNSQLTWTSDDENGAESVVLKSNSSEYLASGPISSIVFTIAADPDAQADVKWDKSELEDISLLAYDGTGSGINQTIDGIVATATASGNGDYCQLLYDSQNDKVSMSIWGNGTLTFAPETGRLTRIVIAGIVDSDNTNLPEESGWTSTANKLIWSGDASFSVDLANASVDHITYVAFTIDDSDPNDTREVPELSFRNGEYELTEATIVRDCHDDIFEPGTYYDPSTEYFLYVNNGVMYYQDQPFIDWATPTEKGLTMTYSVPNNDVITLTKTSGNSFEFTVNGIGDAVVTAHTDGNEDYKPASITFTIHVEEGKAATKECVLKFIGGPNAGQFVPEDYKFEMETGEEFPWTWFELREKYYTEAVYAPSFSIWGSRNYYVASLNGELKLRALTAGDDMFTVQYARCEGGDMNNEYRLIEFPVHIKPSQPALVSSLDLSSSPVDNPNLVFNAEYDPSSHEARLAGTLTNAEVKAAMNLWAYGTPGWQAALPNTISFELPAGQGSFDITCAAQDGYEVRVLKFGDETATCYDNASPQTHTINYNLTSQKVVVIYVAEKSSPNNAPKRAPAAKQDAPVASFSALAVAPTYPITANVDPDHAGVYYSTHYNEMQKYQLPAGTEAYVATVSGEDLNLTKVVNAGEVLPANTAVILKSTSASVVLTPTDAAAVTISATNDLHGVDSETAAPANCYVLSGHSTDNSVTGVGFYEFTGTIPAHKAYLTISGGAAYAPKKLRFVFNNEQQATGIDNAADGIMSEKRLENGQLIIIKNGVRYNAQGQIVK